MRILFVFFFFFLINPEMLQGKWKLKNFDAFLSIMNSKAFKAETTERQQIMAESIQFALNNTFYEFKNDSIYFTDAGAGIIKHKNGKWILKKDTLLVFESGKFKTHKFFIDQVTSNELRLKFVHSKEELSRSSLIFERVE